MKLLLLLLVYLNLALSIEVGSKRKILISMTYGSRSHIKNLFEIGKVLQSRGHELAYMSLKPMLKFSDGYNVTQFQIGPDSIQIDDHRGISEINTKPVNVLEDTVKALQEGVPMVFRLSFKDTLNVIDEYQPDLIMCDFFSANCIDAAYHRNIPLIVGFQTLDGPFLPPPYITTTLNYFPTTIEQLNFSNRIYSTIIHPLIILGPFLKLNQLVNVERKKFNLPLTKGINVGQWGNALKLCNTFIGFEAARPLDPTFKLVGPVLSDEYPSLNKELKEYLNINKNTIYIAFGSGVKLSDADVLTIFNSIKLLLNHNKVDAIIWAIGKTDKSSFNQTSINIKYNNIILNGNDILNSQHPKIKLIEWAPQVAILNHINTKLFISHGGLESAFEAMHSATPILTIPFFGDQYRNARKVEELGIGGYSNRFTHTSLSLYNKMADLLQDENESIKMATKKWQLIAKSNSRKKYEAADIIEDYIDLSKACRTSENNNNKPACEVEYLIPGYDKLPPWLAYGLDVFAFVGITVIILLYPIVYLLLLLCNKVINAINQHPYNNSTKKVKLH